MKKQKPAALVVLVTGILSSTFTGCSTVHSSLSVLDRKPQALNESYVVPSAEDLYIVGKFTAGGPPLDNPGDGYIGSSMEEHYGKDLDLSTRRPVVNLTGTLFEAKYGDGKSLLIANLFHHGKFHIARVPRDGVKNVYFQLNYFPPKVGSAYIAAHSLLRFEMREGRPIELVAPMPDEEGLKRLRESSGEKALALLPEVSVVPLYNVAISAEAQWEKNDPKKEYNLLRGTNGAFVQIVRFVSMEERMSNFYQAGNPVSQIHLEVKQGLDRILEVGLERSQGDGISKLYNTLLYNCTTLAFDIVDQALGMKDPADPVRRFAQRRIPIFAPYKLDRYGATQAIPMQLDSSLAKESQEAYEELFQAQKRELCPSGMEAFNCENVKQAVETFQRELGLRH